MIHLPVALSEALASRSGRRATLRAAAGGLAALFASSRVLPVRAAPPPPPLPSDGQWPVCSAGQEHYCVSAFSVDGVDQLAASDPTYTPRVSGTPTTSGSSFYGGLQWEMTSLGGLQAEDQTKAIVLVIRAGSIPEPVITWLWLRDGRMRVTGDGASGRNLEIRGYPASVPMTDPPMPGGAQAASVRTTWHGNSFLRGLPVLDGLGGFEGYMGGSNVNALGTPHWNGSGWDISVASPHRMPDGSVTYGRYLTWVSPTSLQRLHLTPEEAIAGELVVTRTDNGVVSPVTAAMSIVDGGALIELNDLTFSSPTISVARRSRGACASKCKRGRVCKNGRCVKKKKKKHKKKH